MKITSLIGKHNRVQVFIDNKYYFSCTRNFVVDNRLHTEKELDESEFEDLKRRAQYSIVEFKLMEYASRGRNSEIELRKKVTNYCLKKFDFKPANEFFAEAFDKLKRLHLFSSKSVAKRLGDNYISRSKGRGYVSSKLISKGFKKSDIKEAVDQVNVDQLHQNLKKILKRKLDSLEELKGDQFKLRQKLMQFAANKGYSFKEIKQVLDEILASS